MTKQKIIKGWAVVKRGKIVRHDGEGVAVKPLLVFGHKWLATAAVWLPSEKVVEVEIRYSTS
jgi:hypothetical protein